MKTKADYQKLIADSISAYPAAARFYQVRDPRLLAQLDAMATMLAMTSAEQDVAAMEPFTKARDMTVLADAAAKGVLPFGKPSRPKINVQNASNTALNIATGRRLLDTRGRPYTVAIGATVPALGSRFIEAEQYTTRVVTHTVTASRAFYQIEVPQPEVGYIAAVTVTRGDGVKFEYSVDYVNVLDGDLVYQMKTDENRLLYIQFGASGTTGYQPAAGEEFTLTIRDTEGEVTLSPSSLFTFEYTNSPYESAAKLSMSESLVAGSAPMDIATMREVCSYPSTYDSNAVYLGNFDFLVRRNLSPFKFLSVWNEQREEMARGANSDNINCLFVAARKTGVSQTALRSQITELINKADDSYRIKYVNVADVQIPMEITIYAQPVYDFVAVRQQAEQIILAAYGEDSAWAKRGEAKILYKDVYDTLVAQVQALQDRQSDMRMTVADDTGTLLPEQFRYVSATSLTVKVLEQN